MSDDADVMDGIPELESTAAPTATPAAKPSDDRDDDTPWQHANEHLVLRDVLIDCGWKPAGTSGSGWENFTRPGKQSGPSGGISPDGNCFKLFSSSVAELSDTLRTKDGKMDKWGFFVRYAHGGDFKKAAAEYRKRMPKASVHNEQIGHDDSGTIVPNADGWQIQDASAILSNPPAKPEELIQGLAFCGSKIFLSAHSKARKTWLQMKICAHIATGTPFMGFPVRKSRVLYLNFELHPWSYQNRLRVILEDMGATLEPGMFDVLHLRGQKATIEGLERWCAAHVQKDSYGLMDFDPLYKVLGARSENDASEMGDLLLRLEAIGHHAGAAILISHHFTKGNAAGKEAIDRMSGSGVTGRDGDTIITLTPHEEEDCFALEFICRDFPPVPAKVVRWNYPAFEVDGDLDPSRLKQAAKTASPITWGDVESVLKGKRLNRKELETDLARSTGRGVNACSQAISKFEADGLLNVDKMKRPNTQPQKFYTLKTAMTATTNTEDVA